MPIALLIASILGAIALWLMMPKSIANLRGLGALLGAASLGGLWLYLARWPQDGTHDGLWRWLGNEPGQEGTILTYQYVFSFIAIASAVRVITQTKPVYSALWFIMVVLASSGLFLTLSAEFIAVAMVIIYGGAIVVTYMFVIMLASHAGDPQQTADLPDYDRLAREPMAGVATGFLLLAVLLNVAFYPIEANRATDGESDAQIIDQVLANRAPQVLEGMFASETSAELQRTSEAIGPGLDRLSNVERVGLDLFRSHPLGLELAGIILLVALIGAVVIARMRVEDVSEVAETS